ncbi:hypothetical protein ASG87_05915 [Frateuria sp. Soil773]|uniref:ubiquinone anaerobic biosynthesis accessory factor UbiT n=1 Tax=Frateuria sp. Soil773 TaxID=1736407 RepID=UPI0006FB1478|nr:chorismate mutase [Frateuria sp. Soil773]KRE89078.1 hypothetical protein ASG87_05915 [Frateuria sp. Soil773]
MRPPRLERFALARTRDAIDRIDDGLIVLLAARRPLVHAAAALKPHAGIPPRDPERERRVRIRAQRLAVRLGVPGTSAQRLLDLVIGDACRQQGLPAAPAEGAAADPGLDRDQGTPTRTIAMIAPAMLPNPASAAPRLLRLLPPPRRLAPLLHALPGRWQRRLLEAAMARVLAAPLRDGSLDFMRGRRLAVEVSDLRLRWVLELRGGRLVAVDEAPEASVRGSATDLLLLAGRLEDADTLFFQRALVLTGDTELGLTARNLLERLPWEAVPLGLRIALNRGARLARAARAAYRGDV